MLAKTLQTVETTVEIEEVDVDQNGELTQQYKIRGVPTLVLIEDGVELKRVVGVKSKEELETWINN
jgi:thioredoxin 1